jgi:hypothetical protein
MRKKKVAIKAQDFYNDNIVRISKEQNEYFFEIGKELTTDIAEAVSMLMRQKEMLNSPFWDLEINDILYYEISPEKSLFWLTGGHLEWGTLEHYNKPWCDCYLDFQEEFGTIIVNIVKRSKKLKDIRDGFIKYLNLPLLYDFAIKKNIVK